MYETLTQNQTTKTKQLKPNKEIYEIDPIKLKKK